MSRWIDEYENHPYRSSWNTLKRLVGEATVDDGTIITSVDELMRLKKVTEYLDELLINIDAELTPLVTWDSFKSQADEVIKQVDAYESNRNIAHLHQANTHLDNLLTYIRPYMVLPKAAAASLKRSATIYSKAIKQKANVFLTEAKELLNVIHEVHQTSDALASDIVETNERITILENDLFDEGIEDKINKLVKDFELKKSEIEEASQNILLNRDEAISHKNEIEQSKQSILVNQEEINEILEIIESETKELNKFYIKSFGSEDDSGELVGGIKQEIEELQDNLKVFEEDQKTKYTALNEEIETLLPGATSAGLATAFKDMKDSFKWPSRIASWTFYFSLIVMMIATFATMIESFEFWKIKFIGIGDWQNVLRSMTTKLPLFVPIIWMAYYSTKRRSEYKRLEQEYAHKETLAKSYQSFKKQIEETKTNNYDLLHKLLDKSIESLSHNASETLDKKHGDKMPIQEIIQSTIDKISKSE
jgi:hypothetical protein